MPGVDDPFFSCTNSSSAEMMRQIMEICFADTRTVLDLTFGAGLFWRPEWPRPYKVVGVDLDPARHPDLVGDFRHLDCPDARWDTVVFDPPYITNPGRDSVMAARFGGYATVEELEDAVFAGVQEAWRLCRLGIIVKVQNHIHGNRFVPMTSWVQDAVPVEMYDEAVSWSPKIVDPKWKNQISVWHNHASYLIFRKGDQTHRRRRPRHV